jgi:hypothetical protein
LLPVLAYLAFVLCHNITAPWTLEDNYNGAIYSQAAHNYLRAGLLRTAGVPSVLYFGPLPIPAKGYYVHHPCLLPMAVAGAFAILGEHEWSARLIPITASLLTAVLVWLLVWDCAGARAASLSAAIFATLPMELNYGEMVNFEPVALFWMVGALLMLRYWQNKGKPVWRNLMLTTLFFGLWTEWLGYFFAIIMALHFLITARKKRPGLSLLILAMAAVSGILFLLQIRLVNPAAWEDVGKAFRFRLSEQGATGMTFTWWEWAQTVGMYQRGLIPPFQWLIACIGTVYILRRRFYLEGMRFLAWASGCLFLMDAVYIVAFRNASYIHDYAGFYFIAPVSIMGGLLLDVFANWIDRFARERFFERIGSVVVCAIIAFLAVTGYSAALKFDSQFYILDGDRPEPPNLIPDLGRLIAKTFPENTKVLCNFDPYCSALPYYAQRSIVNNVATPDDWQSALARLQTPLGGVIWLDAPEASEIISSLKQETAQTVDVDGIRFCIWKP